MPHKTYRYFLVGAGSEIFGMFQSATRLPEAQIVASRVAQRSQLLDKTQDTLNTPNSKSSSNSKMKSIRSTIKKKPLQADSDVSADVAFSFAAASNSANVPLFRHILRKMPSSF